MYENEQNLSWSHPGLTLFSQKMSLNILVSNIANNISEILSSSGTLK